MKGSISRRRFLEASLLGGGGVTFFLSASGLLAKATESRGGICVTLCNHWSYTGIGWQLGLESCVLSATDAMQMADRARHVKTWKCGSEACEAAALRCRERRESASCG